MNKVYARYCHQCKEVFVYVGPHGQLAFCSVCRPIWERARARACGRLNAAVRNKKIRHPACFACTDCGKDAIFYDHRDYSKPFDVEPVCRSCNARRGQGKPLPDSLFNKVWESYIPEDYEYTRRRLQAMQMGILYSCPPWPGDAYHRQLLGIDSPRKAKAG